MLFEIKSKFHRLKDFEFAFLDSTDIIDLKKICMDKLEALCFRACDMSDNFHEIFENCPKLKSLEISECNGESTWHDRKYPTLEVFTYNHICNRSRKYIELTACVEGIPMFLERNPNIRKFGTNDRYLREQWEKMSIAVSIKNYILIYS